MPDLVLVEWLETAISVREFTAKTVVAESFTDGVWTYDYQGRPVPRIKGASWESTINGGVWDCTDDMDSCDETRSVGAAEGIHIALNDPAAVLRRCQADRKIVALHQQVAAEQPGCMADLPTGCQTCHSVSHCGWTLGEGLCDTIRLLAEGYGYQEGL